MSSDMGKAAVKVSIWIILTSVLLMFFIPAGTASFYANILAMLVGFLSLGVIVAVLKKIG